MSFCIEFCSWSLHDSRMRDKVVSKEPFCDKLLPWQIQIQIHKLDVLGQLQPKNSYLGDIKTFLYVIYFWKVVNKWNKQRDFVNFLGAVFWAQTLPIPVICILLTHSDYRLGFQNFRASDCKMFWLGWFCPILNVSIVNLGKFSNFMIFLLLWKYLFCFILLSNNKFQQDLTGAASAALYPWILHWVPRSFP